MKSIAVLLRAFGFTVAYGGIMIWAIHQFGRNCLGQEGPDKFSSFMLFLSGVGMVIGLFAVLVLIRKTKPRC